MNPQSAIRNPQWSRRALLAASGAALVGPWLRAQAPRVVKNARLKQSVSRWPYNAIPLPDFCRAIAEMGLPAIDLLEMSEWPIAREHGLVCSMGYAGGGSIPDALNVKANHDAIVRNFEQNIPKAAAARVPNVITFFGNRRGTVCVELLNSKVNHKDYQGDHTAFGVRVVKAVDSPRVKLLYDIYHMQIMEGDVIRTIRDNHQYIAHYHTGGVPGRHELDDTQELNWKAIAQAIVDTGFPGYFAHEFVPTRDPLTSLRDAVALCDV